MLVSAVQQRAISYKYTHMPSLLSLPAILAIPPFQVISEHREELPNLHSRVPFAIYLIPGSMYLSMLLSQFISPSLPDCAHKAMLQVCVSIPALQTGSSGPFFV